ncbi:hypothetical protein BC567DRAFT_36397 [Phyllosticta citribraziliensis]
MLSRRLIYFIAEDAIFDGKGPNSHSAKPSYLPNAAFHRDPGYHKLTYRQAVYVYTGRELSDENDILKAFAGVFCHLFGQYHKFGLPTNAFDEAIAWCPIGTSRKRRKSFPSWSWASVTGKSTFNPNPTISVASWAFVDSDQHENISMTWPRPSDFSFEIQYRTPLGWVSPFHLRRFQIPTAVESCRHGCMLTTPPGLEVADMDWTSLGFRSAFKRRWPSNKSFWEACRGMEPGQTQPLHLRLFSEHQKRLALRHGRILVLSQTANLSVQHFFDEGEDTDIERYRILDGTDVVGAGFFDVPHGRGEAPGKIRFLALACAFEKKLTILSEGRISTSTAQRQS